MSSTPRSSKVSPGCSWSPLIGTTVLTLPRFVDHPRPDPPGPTGPGRAGPCAGSSALGGDEVLPVLIDQAQAHVVVEGGGARGVEVVHRVAHGQGPGIRADVAHLRARPLGPGIAVGHEAAAL